MSTPPGASEMPPESRRFSIRLPRPLWMLLATVVIIVVGIGIRFGAPLYRERTVVARIERLGGKVERRPSGQVDWLRGIIGDAGGEYFDDVVSVDLTGTLVTDADLVELEKLPELETLNLSHTSITDKGLEQVQRLNGLKALVLTGTAVTDSSLAQIEKMPQLEGLGLIDTHITDQGLERLEGLTRLKDLGLSSTLVTDAGLVHLHGLTELRLVCIEHTRVTEKGIAELERRFPRLAIQR